MKTFIYLLFLSSLVYVNAGSASCSTDQIKYSHSTSIGFSFEGLSSLFNIDDSSSLGLPLYKRDTNEETCIENISSFQVEVEDKDNKVKGHLNIKLPQLKDEGENIITNNYLFFEPSLNQQNPQEMVLHFVSFACWDRSLIVQKTFSGTIQTLMESGARETFYRDVNDNGYRFNTVLIAGEAAVNYLKGQKKDNLLPPYVLNDFYNKIGGVQNLNVPLRSNISTPNLISSEKLAMGLVAMQNQIVSGTLLDGFGCSDQFTQAEYRNRIDNVDSPSKYIKIFTNEADQVKIEFDFLQQ